MRPDRNLAVDSCVSPKRARWPPAAGWDARRQGGDGAAVDAMRQLSSVSMRGVVVIGDGEEDQAPMLYNGEEVGNGRGSSVRLRRRPRRREATPGTSTIACAATQRWAT